MPHQSNSTSRGIFDTKAREKGCFANKEEAKEYRSETSLHCLGKEENFVMMEIQFMRMHK